MDGVYGAIDIGGSKIGVAVADAEGRVLARQRFATLPARGASIVLGEAIASLKALVAAQPRPLQAIGIGACGPLDLDRGLMMSPPNFPGWDAVPLCGPFAAAFGVPVALDNDANAAALAEYAFGAGRGAEIMVYATISTGIGGGVVVGGKLLHGLGGGAGEFGHQTIVPQGPRCGCGNFGCLEAVASGSAIARRAREGARAGDAPRVLALSGDLDAIHAGHVAEAADLGEPFARRLWDETIEYLAIGLGNVIATLAPDRLVLGGGVVATGDRLLVPLRKALSQRVRMLPFARLDLRVAENVHEAGLIGALAVALHRAQRN